MFLVNSRLDHFSAPHSRGVPLSRSYGVNLPSSLAVDHSSTLGFSPRPPVSVYGTGRRALGAPRVFSPVWLPALSDCPETLRTVGFRVAPTAFNVLFRQDAAVSLLGPRGACAAGDGILTVCPSRLPLRVTLSSRLTLIRLTWIRNPWAFGVNVLAFIIVTHTYIFFSYRSSGTRVPPSALVSMLPYHPASLQGPWLRRRS